MLAFLKALVLLPIVAVVVLFAIANRTPVTLSLDPISAGPPEIAFAVPLYALLFGAVALGVLIGGVGSWLAAGRARRAGRSHRRDANRLRAEADRLRANLAATRNPALPAPGRSGL